jgi:hypothetical protein
MPDITEDTDNLLDDVSDVHLEPEIPAAPKEIVPLIGGRQRKTASVLSTGHRLQYRHRRSTRRHGISANGPSSGVHDHASSTPDSGMTTMIMLTVFM